MLVEESATLSLNDLYIRRIYTRLLVYDLVDLRDLCRRKSVALYDDARALVADDCNALGKALCNDESLDVSLGDILNSFF